MLWSDITKNHCNFTVNQLGALRPLAQLSSVTTEMYRMFTILWDEITK